MNAFEAASGFSVSWIHSSCILITGTIVLIVGAALVACLVHKLNDGVYQKGAELISYMLFIAMIVTIVLGVLKTM